MGDASTKSMKGLRLEVPTGQPMRISDWEVSAPDLTPQQQEFFEHVTDTMAAYFKQIELLLNTRYSHLKEFVPSYLAEIGIVLVACCSDGVVVRFDKRAEKKEKFVAWFPDNITGAVKGLSNGLIELHPEGEAIPEADTGIDMRLGVDDPQSGVSTTILEMRVRFDAVLKLPERLPPPPQKPFCLMSVKSAFEFALFGRMLQRGDSSNQGRPVVSVMPLHLPVGWECIEVYPITDCAAWKSDFAPLWAERDLLAAAMTHQMREHKLKTMDPYADVRRQFETLFVEFKSLLDSEPEREETLQRFVRDHPQLLCPAQLEMWPKLALGARETDFIFRDASGDYFLVELERSTLRLFKKDGHQTAELTHALGQITDWKRYLEDNLATVQRELGLTGISASPRSLVVMGRTSMLDTENRRKLVTIENEQPKTKILTYDDVLKNAVAVVENLLGPLFFNTGSARMFFLSQPVDPSKFFEQT